jgi:flagellar hook assembly protein FlgD
MDTGTVAVAVYDLEGRKVRTLPDARLTDGQGLSAWDGRDDSGADAASGVYVYRLRCGDLAAAGKVVLTR